ncbi:FxsA family protein [Pseudoalteromonas sp. SSDWG2]|uniref:FxsA family protein n=1 Tax=Pseudoalteromonas sp. SSDWG2 TaxID=3139391 RepID=UPI003BAAFE3E
MFRALFLLFIIIPIVEIALLIQVSEVIGGFATIALIVITAIIGAKLVKQQGVGAMRDAQVQMAQGQIPAEQMFTGICVIIAGVLLLTPGIMTDVFGFLLLTPAVRKRMAKAFASHAQVHMTQGGGFSAHYQSSHTRHHSAEQHSVHKEHQQSNTTIEGEFERKE